ALVSLQSLRPNVPRAAQAEVELVQSKSPEANAIVRRKRRDGIGPLVGEGVELAVGGEIREMDGGFLASREHLGVGVFSMPGERDVDDEIPNNPSTFPLKVPRKLRGRRCICRRRRRVASGEQGQGQQCEDSSAHWRVLL